MKARVEQIIQAIDEINLMVAIISRDNTLIAANKTLLDFAKVSIEDIEGIAYWDLPWWQHSPELQNKLLFAINDSMMGQTSRFEASHSDYEGNIHEIDFIIKPVMKDDEAQYFIAMGYNITELVGTREALTRRERQINAFFEYSIEGYIFFALPDSIHRDDITDIVLEEIKDHISIESYNQRLKEILEIDKIDSSIFDYLNIDLSEYLGEMIEHGMVNIESTIEIDGEIKYLKMIIVAIFNEDIFEGSFAIVRDETKERKNLENIIYLANNDVLTGINNRRSFYKEAEERILETSVQENNSIVMLDIDFFKKVNDTYGHDAGDYVIQNFAQILSEGCHEGLVGRYGGEEFVAIISKPLKEVFEMFDNIRRRIEDHVFIFKEVEIRITTSLGIYQLDRGDTLEVGLSNADIALYESKQNGRNQTTIFVEEIHGKRAFDAVTGMYVEASLAYRVNKLLVEIEKSTDMFHFIYLELQVIQEMAYLTNERHLKTLAQCISKAASDYKVVGRLGEMGFVLVLEGAYQKRVEDMFDDILNNLELGFNGMINKIVNIYGGTFDGGKLKGFTELKKLVNTHKKLLF